MDDNFVVQTNYGPVRGCKRTSIVGEEYMSFRGVPYARPPLGDLRFKDPQPPEPWNTALDCTVPGKCAMAYNLMEDKVLETCSENCLFVNVYTKQLNPTEPQPVLVWIHGGAFIAGDCTEFMTGPDYLLQRNVVFVSVNYRLGALGFLSLDDPNLKIPGNAGLKDQTLALRWVRENIQHFGGDNKNVTLFGVSAGAVSVHFHLLSAMSENLFDKAISQSGTAFISISDGSKGDWTLRLAKAMGWDGVGGEKEIYGFLKSADAAEIVKHQSAIINDDEKKRRISTAFAPCIESYTSEQNFLTKTPAELIENAWGNKVPLIIGATSEEGLLYYFDLKGDPVAALSDKSFENLLPPAELHLTNGSAESKRMIQQMKKFYYGQESTPLPNEENLMRFLDIIGDRQFLYGIRLVIKYRTKDVQSAATYFYRFNFQSDFNALRKMFGFSEIKGVCHVEELVYMFKNDIGTKPEPDTIEQKILDVMCDSWTNFASTGDPNNNSLLPVYWDKVAASLPYKCLNISNAIAFIDNPEEDRMKLWDAFYDGIFN